MHDWPLKVKFLNIANTESLFSKWIWLTFPHQSKCCVNQYQMQFLQILAKSAKMCLFHKNDLDIHNHLDKKETWFIDKFMWFALINTYQISSSGPTRYFEPLALASLMPRKKANDKEIFFWTKNDSFESKFSKIELWTLEPCKSPQLHFWVPRFWLPPFYNQRLSTNFIKNM